MLQRSQRRRIEVDDLQGAVAVAGIEPPAMGCHTVRPRMVVVDGVRGIWIEHDADESADGSLPLERMGVDDVNSGIGAVAQVILAAIRIDPADIERTQRIARYENAGDTFGLGRAWGPGAGARTCHCLIGRERPG